MNKNKDLHDPRQEFLAELSKELTEQNFSAEDFAELTEYLQKLNEECST